MDKSKLVNSYFEAFRAKDIESLKSIMGTGFGIRTFLGSLMFNLEDIELLLKEYNLIDTTHFE